MRVGILTFEQFHGRKHIGSSRIRGHWLAKYWDEAEVYKVGGQYDVLIFQKVYWPDMARNFPGIKIFDICDPDFLDWRYQTMEMIDAVDAITTSTEALAEQFRQFTDKPVLCIPDRLDLEFHTERKEHAGRAQSVVWFGYKDNFPMIDPVMYFLEKYNLNLHIISNGSYLPQINFVKPSIQRGMTESELKEVSAIQESKKFWVDIKNFTWNIETVNADIIKGDIVINPTSTAGKWKYKSNNKTITAWALGMPVAANVEELERLLDEGERKAESERRLQEVKEQWDVRISVEEYKKLIDSLTKK